MSEANQGGVRRPNFKPNVKANLAVTQSLGKFIDIPKGTSNLVRFLPPGEDGMIWTRLAQHYGFADEDDPNRTIALACLEHHGNETTGFKCWVCDFLKVLASHYVAKNPILKTVVRGKGSIALSNNYYTRAMRLEKDGDKYVSKGVQLLRLPSGGVHSVNKIMSEQAAGGEDLFTDIDKGQALTVTNNGKGPVWYEASRSGVVVGLDELSPNWVEAMGWDMYMELAPRIMARAEQRKAAERTYGSMVDFDDLQKEFGL